jgi:hypothetical protein
MAVLFSYRRLSGFIGGQFVFASTRVEHDPWQTRKEYWPPINADKVQIAVRRENTTAGALFPLPTRPGSPSRDARR